MNTALQRINNSGIGLIDGWPYGSRRRVFDRIFDDLARPMWSMDIDVPVKSRDDGESVVYAIDVPGAKREDISVSVKGDGVLSVSWKADIIGHDTAGSKRFTIQNGLDASSVDAKLEDGVLYVTIGKLPEVTERRVEVE